MGRGCLLLLTGLQRGSVRQRPVSGPCITLPRRLTWCPIVSPVTEAGEDRVNVSLSGRQTDLSPSRLKNCLTNLEGCIPTPLRCSYQKKTLNLKSYYSKVGIPFVEKHMDP